MAEHACELTPMDSETWETTIGVEVVRCRDCKHSYEDRRCTSTGWVDVLVCESKQWSTSSLMPNHTVKDDGFCKWGERREDA